jgi:wyosine [tRNA(Phe)-imidazoG37] synthetase (radical SAM superfamily)
MQTIFGPINSRRFGSSLGVDLSPTNKQCNFDCLYCELAPSQTMLTQTNVVEVTTIIDELRKKLNSNIDVITLTANGEPTLYPYLDKLIFEIDKIKNKTQTLILTNSAALIDKKVFQSLLKLDQVKLSLDAISEDIFKKIDRPHKSIEIQKITQKIIEFSNIYNGKLFIEILFVDKLNNTIEEIEKLNKVLIQLQVQRIDIGTIDRPPAYNVQKISYQELYKISNLFDSTLPIHIASRVDTDVKSGTYTNDEILNTLDKRPLTLEDIDLLFTKETKIRLNNLVENKQIIKQKIGNLTFFRVSKRV